MDPELLSLNVIKNNLNDKLLKKMRTCLTKCSSVTYVAIANKTIIIWGITWIRRNTLSI
jgi:hypothetical protein